MLKVLLSRAVAGLMAVAIILASVVVPVISVSAAPGNNGTLKVHEKGTPSGTESNDPKVCIFNFEGFGFDVGQSGYIVITGQGQTSGTHGNYAFGPTTASTAHTSYAQSTYFNDGAGPTIPNGHYEATLYGKQSGAINLADEKAKSKVFKIECETPAKDAAASVTVLPATCYRNGLASVAGLVYATLISNGGDLDQSVGTHTAVFGSTTGHVFSDGQSTYEVSYTIYAQLTGEQCDEQSEVITPESPESYDFCYSDADYIWVPFTEGVIYRVNDVIAEGYVAYEGESLIVTATADVGYELAKDAVTSWLFDESMFSNEQCLSITKSAVIATDTNKDGRISFDDTITWTITVTNTSNKDYESFYVVVEDENAILENDGYIGFLAANENKSLSATSIITVEHVAACKITNTAELSGWRAFDRMAFLMTENQETVVDDFEDMPLVTNSATAEYVLDCKPGMGSVKPDPKTSDTPKVPQVAELPYTAASATPLVAAGALSLAGIILAAGSAIKSRLLA